MTKKDFIKGLSMAMSEAAKNFVLNNLSQDLPRDPKDEDVTVFGESLIEAAAINCAIFESAGIVFDEI